MHNLSFWIPHSEVKCEFAGIVRMTSCPYSSLLTPCSLNNGTTCELRHKIWAVSTNQWCVLEVSRFFFILPMYLKSMISMYKKFCKKKPYHIFQSFSFSFLDIWKGCQYISLIYKDVFFLRWYNSLSDQLKLEAKTNDSNHFICNFI